MAIDLGLLFSHSMYSTLFQVIAAKGYPTEQA